MAMDSVTGTPNAAPVRAVPAAAAPAAAPAAAAGAAQTTDESMIGRVGDVLGAAKDMLTSPTMATIAAYAASPFTGMAALIAQAFRIWNRGSQVKTEAFLAANLAKFTPAGQETLKKLAAKGVLDLVDPGWNTLRDNLDGFLKAGGDPRMAETILAQIANPIGGISQARPNTCVATTIQLAIARDNPAQYFQMAAELGAGKPAKLPNGDTIAASPANRAWIEAQHLAPEDRLNALFQAALMDYASDGGYDAAADVTTTAGTAEADGALETRPGLKPAQARKLNDALVQMPILDVHDLVKLIAQAAFTCGTPNVEAVSDALEDAVAEAQKSGHGGVMVMVGAPASIELPPALKKGLNPDDWVVPRFHMVLVKDVKDGVVTYLDPLGQTRTEPLEDFARRVCTDESAAAGSDTSAPAGGVTRPGRPR